MLLRGGVEGERIVAEACAQLRNISGDEVLSQRERTDVLAQLGSLASMLARHRKRSEPDEGATPETKGKRRRDAVGPLVKAGKMADVHAEALRGIAAGYALGCGDVAMKQFAYRPPLDRTVPADWSGRQVRTWELYTQWHRRMDQDSLYADPVMYFAVEAGGVRETERHFGMRSGTFLTDLAKALDLYCDIAGWPKAPPQNHEENQRVGTAA